MGAVHLLPGATSSNIAERGAYALCGHPADARPSITLRSDADYRALAQEILESAEWRGVQGSSPTTRNRVLGRLMNQALEPMSRGRAGGPGRAGP